MTLARAFQALFVLETNGRPVKYLTPFHPSLRPRFSNLRESRFEKFLPKFYRATRNCFGQLLRRATFSPLYLSCDSIRGRSISVSSILYSILFYAIGPFSWRVYMYVNVYDFFIVRIIRFSRRDVSLNVFNFKFSLKRWKKSEYSWFDDQTPEIFITL